MASTLTERRRGLGGRLKAIFRHRKTIEGDLLYLSTSDVRELIDRTARQELGMTAEEFYAAAERGELDDTPAVAHLRLISGARPR